MEKPPFEQLVRKVQVTSKTIYVIDVALGCNSELESKTIVKEITHVGQRTRGVWLELSWGPLPLSLTLIGSEGAMQAAKGKEKSTVLPSCKVYEPQQ